MKLSGTAKTWAKLAATALIGGAVILSLDTSKLMASLVRVDPAFMALGMALCFVFVACRMLKWIVLSRANGLRAATPELIRSMLFALALGIVTPGRVGEVVAILPFAKENRPKALMAYLYDRIGELGTVLLFSAPAAIVLLPVWGTLLAAGIVLGVTVLILGMESLTLRALLGRMLPAWFPRRVSEILRAPLRSTPSYWALSVVTYAVTYASVAAFIAGTEPIRSFEALLVLPVVTLSNLITITFGGLGVREGLAALVSPSVNLTPEVTAAAFFLSFVWTRLVPAGAGLLWVALTPAAPTPPPH